MAGRPPSRGGRRRCPSLAGGAGYPRRDRREVRCADTLPSQWPPCWPPAAPAAAGAAAGAAAVAVSSEVYECAPDVVVVSTADLDRVALAARLAAALGGPLLFGRPTAAAARRAGLGGPL